jgi:copper(I)-binding protein
MEMKGAMMKMGPVAGIDLPAGKAVNLASGGYHIMLTGLKQQLKEGETVTLTLLVEGKDKRRESVTVKVPVKPMTFVTPAAHAH